MSRQDLVGGGVHGVPRFTPKLRHRGGAPLASGVAAPPLTLAPMFLALLFVAAMLGLAFA